MHDRHLFTSRRQRKSGDLHRLEMLATAARLGTAWLQGDTMEPSVPAGILSGTDNDHSGGPCRCTPEHCHG